MKPQTLREFKIAYDDGMLTGIPFGLFLFHAPVLEPYLDLSLGQSQRPGQIDTPGAVQVLVGRKRLLQVHQLFARVSGPLALLFFALTHAATLQRRDLLL